ncbi:MAG TPA: TonB-dependent receptor [Steroidobacteraceae bacterium]|jgi:outer membrane receptor protein involved in Fe transport|nr:TonB-dependent receptor [Steroidobacteraceae bacterium]
MRRNSRNIRFSASAFLVATLFRWIAADAQALVHFDLPAQPLARSLKAIGTATNTDVGFSASEVAGLLAPPLKADLTVDGALQRVLVGTGLRPKHLNDHTIVIALMRSSAAESAKPKSSPIKAAGQAEAVDQPDPPQADTDSSNSASPSNDRKRDLDEIIVTGTNLRGVKDSASPVQIFTRADIDRTGQGTLQSFFERLPQNFGSISENTISTVAGSATAGNAASASAINLRGLGSDSTLLLVDGHRVAPGGINGDIADVSLIPLSAVDRVEIVTDGASAIYGSDAVGGVVNVILRKDFDGAETRARFGSVSEGASHETQIGQTVGKTWASGSAVLSYEYLDRTPLSAADREFSRAAVQPTDLLPEQVRHGVFATIQQEIASGFSLFADGTFSHRTTAQSFSSLGFSQEDPADIEAYSGVLGGRARLWDKTEIEISASYASSKQHIEVFQNSFSNGNAPETSTDIHTNVLSFDAKLDGSLGSLRAGDLSYAVGAQLRHEALDSSQYSFASASGSSFDPHRTIDAGFAELRIPLLAATASSIPILELNLADRYEHYSDFGATNNPQLGLIWKPVADVKFRGTVGTSFKAPLLNDLNPNPSQVVVLPEFDPQGGEQTCFPFNSTNTCSNTIIAIGGNPRLTAEKARTWTAGFDAKPSAIPGLSVSTTYYSIYSRDRITDPSSLFPLTIALQNAPTLGSAIVQRNPSAALVQQLAATPSFINPFNIDLSSLGAFVDYRFQNLSSVRTSGVDLNLSYKMAVFGGEFETGIDGTYILEFDNRFTSATPEANLLNTPFNPVDLRLRPRAEFRIGPFSAAVFLNYTNSYEDNRGTVPVPVAPWTTVDMNVAYACASDCWFLQHTTIMAGVTNIANKEPPFLVNASGFGVNFDGTNANALGRFIYLQVSTKW